MEEARSTRPPNILLIHWHDLGRHLGAYGASSVHSPNLDRLAAEGICFTQSFCTAPLCSPARSSLFTGRYPHANGMHGLAHLGWSYGPGERTLPMLLGEHGWHSVLIGVQHESEDATSLGFDELLHLQSPRRAGPVSDTARAWLASRTPMQRPFLLVVGFSEVHREYPADLYPPDDPELVDVPAFLPDNSWTRRDLAGFQSAIRSADAGVGRLLEALEANNMGDDTWVIFTTDHGIAFPRAKSTLYDPGIEVALIMRLPRYWRDKPRSTNRLVSHVDLVPTILKQLGLPVPTNVQGISHAAFLGGNPAHARDTVFAEKTFHDSYDPIRAIRSESFKYIVNTEERPRLVFPRDIEESLTREGLGADNDMWLQHRPAEELYNLRADPLECTNLANSPEYADQKQSLAERLRAWQAATADPLLEGAIQAVPRPLPPWRGHPSWEGEHR